MTRPGGRLVEVQSSGEKATFTQADPGRLVRLAMRGGGAAGGAAEGGTRKAAPVRAAPEGGP